MADIELNTERCRLRPLGVEHAEFVYRLLNDPSYLRYIGDRGVRSPGQAADYIQSYFNAQCYKNEFGYFVVSNHAKQAMGVSGLMHREPQRKPDLGYAFLQQFQNKGYAYESTNAVLKEIASRYAPIEIEAVTNMDNIASQKILNKLGFRQDKCQDQSNAYLYRKRIANTVDKSVGLGT